MSKPKVFNKMVILAVGKPKLPSMKNPYGTEEELLAAFLRHERAAQNHIYSEVWPFARKYVLQNSGSTEDARTVLHDALLLFFNKLHTGRYRKTEEASYTTFVNRIIILTWLNELRKRKIEMKRKEQFEDVPEPSEPTYSDKDKELLNMALGKLEEDCQKVVRMGYFEKLSHEEVATLLGYTKSFAKKKRFLCKEKLTSIFSVLKVLDLTLTKLDEGCRQEIKMDYFVKMTYQQMQTALTSAKKSSGGQSATCLEKTIRIYNILRDRNNDQRR